MNVNANRFFFLILIGMLAILSCAGRRTIKEPPPVAEDTPYDFEDEGRIPPLKESDIKKEADIEEISVVPEDVYSEVVQPEIDSAFVIEEKPIAEPNLKEGYRIQVFASASSEAAAEIGRAAEKKLSVAAYVDFIDGIYKVRLGDFLERGEAEKFLSRCKEAGYGDAWIVKALVHVQKRKAKP